jgi:hypothetical protein
MLSDVRSLERQLTKAEENLRLIEERMSDYVVSTDVPLSMVREKRELERRIDDLKSQLAQVERRQLATARPARRAVPAWAWVLGSVVGLLLLGGSFLGIRFVLKPKITPPATLIFTARGWREVFKDYFDADEGKWDIGDFDDGWEKGTWSIADGKYRWELEAIRDDALRPAMLKLNPVSDFYMSVEAKLVKGSGDDVRYGLMFRKEGDNYYTFRVEDGPNFRVRSRQDGEWTNLIDWTRGQAIGLGRTNRLEIIAEGTRFYFYIDGQYVGKVDDDTLDRGNVGLVVNINHAGDAAVLEFDNFELRCKPGMELCP